jgi:ABC-2 type transport system ATP-binding protein
MTTDTRRSHRPAFRAGPTHAARVPAPAALVLSELTKSWGKDQPPVLDDISLTLSPGTITWVGGRNGAGKTTLLRIAAGLIEPDRGRAEAMGFSPRENRGRYQHLVSFLPAGDRGLYARLSVRRHLEFWSRISMIPRQHARQRVSESIQQFALADLAERRVDRMSMGQRQRLRIAMTFLARPRVVLLDEPLTSLDDQGTELLEGALQELTARGGAALWCSPTGEHLTMAFTACLAIERGRLRPS